MFDADVVMGEHHALGLAGAAARKNHGREIIERFLFASTQRALEQSAAGETQKQERDQLFAEARTSQPTLRAKSSRPGTFNFTFSRNVFGRDDRFDVALRRARGQRFFRDGVIQIHRHFAQPASPRNSPARPARTAAATTNHFLPLPDTFCSRPRKKNRRSNASPNSFAGAACPPSQTAADGGAPFESARDAACSCAFCDGDKPPSAIAAPPAALRRASRCAASACRNSP